MQDDIDGAVGVKRRVVQDQGAKTVTGTSGACGNKRRPKNAFGDQGTEADIEEADLSEEENDRKKRKPVLATMAPTPDTSLPVNCKMPPSCDEVDSAGALPIATSTPNDNSKRRRTDVPSEDTSFNS